MSKNLRTVVVKRTYLVVTEITCIIIFISTANFILTFGLWLLDLIP